MWESLGFIVAFAYSSFLCTSVKIYVLLSVLIIGMAGYGVVEYKTRMKPNIIENNSTLKSDDKLKSHNNGIENKAFSTSM